MCFWVGEVGEGREMVRGRVEGIMGIWSVMLVRSFGTSNVESRSTRGLISSMSSSSTHGVGSVRIPASDNVVLLDLLAGILEISGAIISSIMIYTSMLLESP